MMIKAGILLSFSLILFLTVEHQQQQQQRNNLTENVKKDNTILKADIPDTTTNTINHNSNTQTNRRQLLDIEDQDEEDNDPPLRILHIVTALRDINNGTRGTKHGEDRLKNVFIPILKNSVAWGTVISGSAGLICARIASVA